MAHRNPSRQRRNGRASRAAKRRPAKPELVSETPFGEQLALRRYRLGNGLTLLLLVDRAAPVISYQTWFRVGSRHEQPGKTGLAHLFEHLMFNETRNLPAGEFDRLLEAAGAETNAATWVDWTHYYASLPAKHLELIVRLEADRMANLVLRVPQVRSEKEVVANERRYRVDDDVEGTLAEVLYKTAFKKHAYRWPTIGWMRDIQGFTVRDCREFYRRFYAPNNAILVCVGDVDEAQLLDLVRDHYGSLRRSRLPDEPVVREPRPRRERRVALRWPTPTYKLQLGYPSPPLADYDHAVLTIINQLLFGGRSSRLYRRLITGTEVASEARGSVAPFRDRGLYELWVALRRGRAAGDALELVDEELARLQHEPVADDELFKVKNRLELGAIQGLETATGKAEQIGFYETVVGDAAFLFRRLQEYRQVSAADVQRVARETFQSRLRTLVTAAPDEVAA